MINTNFPVPPISHRFHVIADYWSEGIPVFNTLVWGEPINSGPRNLTLKKREESVYRMVLIYWQTIISFCHKARV